MDGPAAGCIQNRMHPRVGCLAGAGTLAGWFHATAEFRSHHYRQNAKPRMPAWKDAGDADKR